MADIEKLDLSMAGERCDDAVLPCPFCGAIPIWSICGENNDLLRFGCPNNCAVWMEPFTRPYHENALKSVSKKWNRRAKPDNEPLTLEELRKMKWYEPVYVKFKHTIPNKAGSNLYDYLCYIGASASNYGKTWLAYRRKPEPEGSENDGPTI